MTYKLAPTNQFKKMLKAQPHGVEQPDVIVLLAIGDHSIL
jgi:hypothetical protein